jgi:hypothetical protein
MDDPLTWVLVAGAILVAAWLLDRKGGACCSACAAGAAQEAPAAVLGACGGDFV